MAHCSLAICTCYQHMSQNLSTRVNLLQITLLTVLDVLLFIVANMKFSEKR